LSGVVSGLASKPESINFSHEGSRDPALSDSGGVLVFGNHRPHACCGVVRNVCCDVPHCLRHSCGYALADRGVDLRTIQEWLGHRSVEMTIRYTRISQRRFSGLWR